MEAMPIQWLQSIPPVTRSYVVCSTALSVAEYLGYIKVSDFLLNSNSPFSFKQMWPIFLNTLYNGTLSMDFCTKLYFFSRYSNWLETYVNSPKNYLWMIFILLVLINLYSRFVSNLSLIGPVLKETLLCIWSRYHADDEVFFVVISLRACWVPWTTYFIDIAISNPRDTKRWMIGLSGILIGHLYWFLNEELPKLHGSKSLIRPIWEWDLFQPRLVTENQIEEFGQRVQEFEERVEQFEQQVNEFAQQVEQRQQQLNDIAQDVDDVQEEINEEIHQNQDFQSETEDTLNHR